jgi:VCBS repeat protein
MRHSVLLAGALSCARRAGHTERLRRATLVAAGCLLAATLVGVAQASDPTFVQAPGSPVPVGINPHSIAIADLNRDGKRDLAVANYGSDNVSILFGNGAGGYGAAITIPVGDGPLAVAAEDLNGDRRPDLAVANAGSDTISILLASRAGGFIAAAPVAVPDAPWYIAVGDLNRDGSPDLAVSHTGFSSTGPARQVSILLGDGEGGFTHAPGSPITVGNIPDGVAIADLNRDRRPDLAVANQFSGNVSILLGNGDGTFTPAPGSPVPVSGAPSWVAAADLNGDRRPDLAVTNQGSDTVSILLGNGDGTFTAAPAVPVAPNCVRPGAPCGPTPVVAVDLNRDRKLDLVVGNIFSDNVSILLGNGAGGFTPAAGSPLAVGDHPFSLAVGRLNRDRRPDLAVANYGSNNVTILLNTRHDDEEDEDDDE